MNLDEIARLCLAPFGEVKPTIFRGAVSNPEAFFGETHIQQMLAIPTLVLRAGLFRDQKFIDPENFPDAYTHEGVQRHRDEGVSLTLRGLQRLPGPVRDVCLELAKTGWPTVHAVALESPEDVQALMTHWDLNPVVAIQTRGRKRWHVYNPVVGTAEEVITAWRERRSGSKFTDEQESRLTPEYAADSVVLEPGDVYFVPAGWPHAPMGVGGSSLHVSICPLPQQVVDKEGNEDHML